MIASLEERFWAKVEKSGECWEWTAAKLPRGHGVIGLGGRDGGNALAHRVSYELAHGTLAGGLVLHHECENPGCVNPRHLKPMTQVEHLAVHAEDRQLKSECPQGHPYSGENLYVNPRGQRFCRICQREAKRRYKARKRNSRALDTVAS
jgi:hypothetical protein